jgi:hypothetical protein
VDEVDEVVKVDDEEAFLETIRVCFPLHIFNNTLRPLVPHINRHVHASLISLCATKEHRKGLRCSSDINLVLIKEGLSDASEDIVWESRINSQKPMTDAIISLNLFISTSKICLSCLCMS